MKKTTQQPSTPTTTPTTQPTVGFKDQHGKKNVTAVWSIDLIEEHFQ